MPDPHALREDEVGDIRAQLESQTLKTSALDPDMKIK